MPPPATVLWIAGLVLQKIALGLLLALGLGLGAYSVASALGHAPWLTLPLRFGETTYPQAGAVLQVLVAALALGLLGFLPGALRVARLEASHRRFEIGMEDIGRAYRAAHAGDRAGAFRMRSEFDSVKERMAFLREHPDLSELEPPVIEIAAQMSHLSRELARIYSDAAVARARDFLIQRQQEVEDFNARLQRAKAITSDMRVWIDKVEMEEAVAEAQLARLCEELERILPELGPAADDATEETPAPAPLVDTEVDAESDEADPRPATADDARIVSLLSGRAAE